MDGDWGTYRPRLQHPGGQAHGLLAQVDDFVPCQPAGFDLVAERCQHGELEGGGDGEWRIGVVCREDAVTRLYEDGGLAGESRKLFDGLFETACLGARRVKEESMNLTLGIEGDLRREDAA